MTETVGIVLVAVIAGPCSAGFVAWLTGRSRRADKKEDWARQDEVAARLLEANVETNGKLDQIHTLVNSNMTAVMQDSLDATKRELAMMGEVIDLKRKAGHEPSAEALEQIETARAKVSEMVATLDDRLRQTDLADKRAEV